MEFYGTFNIYQRSSILDKKPHVEATISMCGVAWLKMAEKTHAKHDGFTAKTKL